MEILCDVWGGDNHPSSFLLVKSCLDEALTLPLLSLQSQHRVAASQHDRFDKWHQGWLANHVATSAERSVQKWLMGEEEEDMIPCKTTCLSTEVKGQAVNRYQVYYSGSKAPASP